MSELHKTDVGGGKHVDEVQRHIDALIDASGIEHNQALIRNILTTGVGLGQDDAERLNLKISSAALEEMRNAFRLFTPYQMAHKVTIFGSARTQQEDPLWQLAETVARRIADHDWYVVTGAGPGIMEAAAQGAGEERALGVSIRLPFEEAPNEVIAVEDRLVSMKYFFTRKLMLVKESRGFVCLPGGFGTMDELFELLTLQQTGKMVPVPIVLLDRDGGTFWSKLIDYIDEELDTAGMINHADMDRVFITNNAEAAVEEIIGFWRNYDSIRWFGDTLVFRLRATPSDADLDRLNTEHGHLTQEGHFERATARKQEIRDDDLTDLPRIQCVPIQRQVGELHRIIRTINSFETAPGVGAKPSQ